MQHPPSGLELILLCRQVCKDGGHLDPWDGIREWSPFWVSVIGVPFSGSLPVFIKEGKMGHRELGKDGPFQGLPGWEVKNETFF
jgi:hypothetical protein